MQKLLLSTLVLSLSIFLAIWYYNSSQTVVKYKDYQAYIQNTTPIANNQGSIDFWTKKLKAQPDNFVYKQKLAGLLAERFKATGNIQDILQSDELLENVLTSAIQKKASVYHALSANAITQHQFKKALFYANQGLETGDAPKTSHLLRFDALMEIGEFKKARAILAAVEDKNDFSYLIRQTKMLDHDGDLDAGLVLMERAADWCKRTNRTELYCWAKSNLGDMYGHAGRVRKSYESYLEVLSIDENYHYALKGIAWIAYSKDKNIPAARELANYLLAVKKSPDMYLLLAEMAAYEGNEAIEKENIERFVSEAKKPVYGNMYDQYLADLALDYFSDQELSELLAYKEISNRPTPQSYQLLARHYYQQNELDKAIEVLDSAVAGLSYEPDILFHLGMIYKAGGEEQKAKEYLTEAYDAQYELGPMTTKEIESLLADL